MALSSVFCNALGIYRKIRKPYAEPVMRENEDWPFGGG